MLEQQPSHGHVSTLTLRITPRENPDWPAVDVLVDGADPFGVVAPEWFGFDPDVILGPTSPLLPARVSRRVAVLRCSCSEAGCGAIAPLIETSADGRYVLWRDFGRFVGEFFGPLAADPRAQPSPTRDFHLPDLRFDARQYAAQVHRASQDRSWETPRRTTARLLRELLDPLALSIPPGSPLCQVFPAWEMDGIIARFGREFPDGRVDYRDLRLTSTRTEPDEAATDMATQLRATPAAQWARRFPPGY